MKKVIIPKEIQLTEEKKRVNERHEKESKHIRV